MERIIPKRQGKVHALGEIQGYYSDDNYIPCYITLCGRELDTTDFGDFEISDSKVDITCKHCLNKIPPDDPVIFHEVKIASSGDYVFVPTASSAQEAAETVADKLGIELSEIECVHVLRSESVVFPTVSKHVTFEE